MQNSAVYKLAMTESQTKEISRSAYNLILGGMLAWGFGLNFYIVKHIASDIITGLNPLIFLLAYIVLCISGIFIVNRTKSLVWAFIGYTMIVAPMGVAIYANIAVSARETVILALKYTSLVTIGMMALGTIFPGFFNRIAGALFVGLSFAIVLMILSIFFPALASNGWLDKFILLLFCGYIGFDWGFANSMPSTPINAIRGASMLYIDIINLFVVILRLMSRRN